MKRKVIYHSRKKFYYGKDIYWYEFVDNNDGRRMCDAILVGKRNIFIRVPETRYYEYGGSHLEAIADLTDSQLYDIIEGDEI